MNLSFAISLVKNSGYLIPIVLATLVFADIQLHHKKAGLAAKIAWPVFAFIVPIFGFIIYAFIVRRDLDKTPQPVVTPGNGVQTAQNTWANTSVVPANNGVAAGSSNNFAQAMQNPATVKKSATILGAAITVIAILMGLGVLAVVIFVAVIMYQCSRPGAKCM